MLCQREKCGSWLTNCYRFQSSLRRAQSLEANNPKQSSAEADVDDDDDWEDEEDEATRSTSLRGGVRGSKPRKAARGIVKRIVRLQGSLLQVCFSYYGSFPCL